MSYVDWGAWLKWLVHGNEYTSTDIECDAAAQTCTLQKCEGWECTDYTMPCTEGGEDVKPPWKILRARLRSLGGKEVSVRKYDKRKEVANANAKLGSSSSSNKKKESSKRHGTNNNNNNDNNDILQKRNLLWKQTTSSTRAVPCSVSVRLTRRALSSTWRNARREKSFGKDELSGVEFYPRTKDGSNARNVYLFGQCYNMRDNGTRAKCRRLTIWPGARRHRARRRIRRRTWRSNTPTSTFPRRQRRKPRRLLPRLPPPPAATTTRLLLLQRRPTRQQQRRRLQLLRQEPAHGQ